MRLLLLFLLLTSSFLSLTTKAQRLFIQPNIGYAAAINHNSYNDGKLKGGVTGGATVGIGFLKRLEAGINLSAQKLTEQFPMMIKDMWGNSSLSTYNISYGNPLFTAEGFANVKHKLGPMGMYGGVLAGIAAPWGGTDKSYNLPFDLYNDNINGGTGLILGLQLGGNFSFNKHWGVVANAAYKYIRLKPDGYNLGTGYYTFSMIPVTAGIRYTF